VIYVFSAAGECLSAYYARYGTLILLPSFLTLQVPDGDQTLWGVLGTKLAAKEIVELTRHTRNGLLWRAACSASILSAELTQNRR
jgi:hypothetical protein